MKSLFAVLTMLTTTAWSAPVIQLTCSGNVMTRIQHFELKAEVGPRKVLQDVRLVYRTFIDPSVTRSQNVYARELKPNKSVFANQYKEFYSYDLKELKDWQLETPFNPGTNPSQAFGGPIAQTLELKLPKSLSNWSTFKAPVLVVVKDTIFKPGNVNVKAFELNCRTVLKN